MADDPSAANLIQDLDARQDEVLAKLNELNSALDSILKQYVDSQRASKQDAAGGETEGGEAGGERSTAPNREPPNRESPNREPLKRAA